MLNTSFTPTFPEDPLINLFSTIRTVFSLSFRNGDLVGKAALTDRRMQIQEVALAYARSSNLVRVPERERKSCQHLSDQLAPDMPSSDFEAFLAGYRARTQQECRLSE
jgi:hypothetical protein